MPQITEPFTEGAEVVNLAVLGGTEGPVFVGHGLMARAEIDHCQPPDSEGHGLIDVGALVVRPAVNEGGHHTLDDRARLALGLVADEAGNAAHDRRSIRTV